MQPGPAVCVPAPSSHPGPTGTEPAPLELGDGHGTPKTHKHSLISTQELNHFRVYVIETQKEN